MRTRRAVWAAAALVLLALSAVELRHRSAAFGGSAARDAPTWIWRDHDLRHVQAAGFYAVKELDLVAAPAQAEIRILGDAEYVLTVNGERIGSNRYTSGAPLDRYRVENFLVPGRNRLVVELRSSTGSGGFWFELSSGGRQLARSDGSWSVYDFNWRGLFGERPMPPGSRPRLLGRSPLGRWGSPAEGELRPVFPAVLAAPQPVPARAVRVLGEPAPWRACPPRNRRPRSLGPLVEFDFGAEQTGYLQLAFREESRGREAPRPSSVLLAFGDEPVAGLPWSAQAIFQPIPSAGLYQDSTVRRFRYVAVAGLPGVFSAEVLATTPDSAPRLALPEQLAEGILGIRPPPSSAPVEHEVWRELERAARGTVGEDR